MRVKTANLKKFAVRHNVSYLRRIRRIVLAVNFVMLIMGRFGAFFCVLCVLCKTHCVLMCLAVFPEVGRDFETLRQIKTRRFRLFLLCAYARIKLVYCVLMCLSVLLCIRKVFRGFGNNSFFIAAVSN